RLDPESAVNRFGLICNNKRLRINLLNSFIQFQLPFSWSQNLHGLAAAITAICMPVRYAITFLPKLFRKILASFTGDNIYCNVAKSHLFFNFRTDDDTRTVSQSISNQVLNLIKIIENQTKSYYINDHFHHTHNGR